MVPAVGPKRHVVAALDLGIKRMTPALLAAPRGRDARAAGLVDAWTTCSRSTRTGCSSSNGPGDPAATDGPVALVRGVLAAGVPLFGICFGNQILGRALGFGTYKLRYGHRGINQPVRDNATGRVEVTAHNHGFAVDAPPDGGHRVRPGRGHHVNLNDGVVEGLRCLDLPAFGVQYHPEAAAGPHDADYLFDRFAERCEAMTRSRSGQAAGAAGRGTRMPRRDDIAHVLVIGSGPIVIGQACEFDYSGTQACRVLQGRGAAGQPGQLQPGHDHDRPGVRRRHLRRAAHRRSSSRR